MNVRTYRLKNYTNRHNHKDAGMMGYAGIVVVTTYKLSPLH